MEMDIKEMNCTVSNHFEWKCPTLFTILEIGYLGHFDRWPEMWLPNGAFDYFDYFYFLLFCQTLILILTYSKYQFNYIKKSFQIFLFLQNIILISNLIISNVSI